MMANPGVVLRHDRFPAKAVADSHFAWLRTRCALERTMLAWLRTAIALIGFGFPIVEVFEQLDRISGVAPAGRPGAPFLLGLLMIGAGVAALVVAGWQYRIGVRYLREGNFAAIALVGHSPTQTPAYTITIGLIFIGVFAFLAVVTRTL
jgi:putative membrane protein